MENITVGQFATGVALIAGIIGGFKVIKNAIVQWLNNVLDVRFKDLDNRLTTSLETLNNKIDAANYNASKNFLVRTIGDIDNGRELSETTIERFYENYDLYVHEFNGNSYIKAKVEALEKSGKLERFL